MNTDQIAPSTIRPEGWEVRLHDNAAPCRLLIAECEEGYERKKPAQAVWDWLLSPDSFPYGRGVSADRLPTILRTGIDVEPANAPIFAESGGDKAAEYGAYGDQVIQFFQFERLQRSFKIVSHDTCAEEIEEVRLTYPNLDEEAEVDGLFFTRFKPNGIYARHIYEMNYGYFVPGDPRDALQCVLVLSSHLGRAAEIALRAMQAAGLLDESPLCGGLA